MSGLVVTAGRTGRGGRNVVDGGDVVGGVGATVVATVGDGIAG